MPDVISDQSKRLDLSSAAGAAISAAADILQNIRPLTPAHAKGDSALWEAAHQRAQSVARLAREILEAMQAPPQDEP